MIIKAVKSASFRGRKSSRITRLYAVLLFEKTRADKRAESYERKWENVRTSLGFRPYELAEVALGLFRDGYGGSIR